jgi:hypothetical protein
MSEVVLDGVENSAHGSATAAGREIIAAVDTSSAERFMNFALFYL